MGNGRPQHCAIETQVMLFEQVTKVHDLHTLLCFSANTMSMLHLMMGTQHASFVSIRLPYLAMTIYHIHNRRVNACDVGYNGRSSHHQKHSIMTDVCCVPFLA